MRQFLLAIAVTVGLVGSAKAQNAEIEATIGSQIEAFLADDFGRAFSYASPNIRSIFGTPENFGAMVRGGYPMVWRPKDVRYLELREEGVGLWQQVMITDGKGRVHVLDYQMIQVENAWKINAVKLLQSSDLNA